MRRQAIEEVIKKSGKDPATGQDLCMTEVYPNLALRDLIQVRAVMLLPDCCADLMKLALAFSLQHSC